VTDDFKTVYDVIDAFRRTPALFVGNAFSKEPFVAFSAFLDGLAFSSLDEGTPSVWGFARWITARVRGISQNLPSDWLYEKLGSEAAYEVYLRYLDEYRACKEVTVAVARRVKMRPRFYLMDEELRSHSPPLPDKLFVGQFYPSKVYFLGELYGGQALLSLPPHGEECYGGGKFKMERANFRLAAAPEQTPKLEDRSLLGRCWKRLRIGGGSRHSAAIERVE
jgi:hypothetical protein